MLRPCGNLYPVPEFPSPELRACPYSSAHSHRATSRPRTVRIDNRTPTQLPVGATLLLPERAADFHSRPIARCANVPPPSGASAPPQRTGARAILFVALAAHAVRLSLLQCLSTSKRCLRLSTS